MQREVYFSEYFSVGNYLSAFALWSHGSWNAALLPFRSGQMCLLEKKTFSASQAITTYRVVLLCFFFAFFVVYFVFRFLQLRLTQNHPDAKKLFFFLEPLPHQHLLIPSSVAAHQVGKNHKHKDGQSLKNLSIQNVLQLMSSKHFTSCHSYMCKKYNRIILAGGLRWKSLWRRCCLSNATFSGASPAVVSTCIQTFYCKMVAIPWIKHRKMCEICPTRVS